MMSRHHGIITGKLVNLNSYLNVQHGRNGNSSGDKKSKYVCGNGTLSEKNGTNADDDLDLEDEVSDDKHTSIRSSIFLFPRFSDALLKSS